MPLAEFREDCQALDVEAFRQRHGDAFLVHHGDATQWTEAGHLGTTRRLEGEKADAGMRVHMLVFVVPSSDKTRFPDFVSVGRADNNDIIIRDGSLSKFHAYIRRMPDGSYGLLDVGSKNGTWLEEEAVPVRGEAEPVPLTSGAKIRFGSVRCTFLGVAEFRQLVAMTAAMPS